MIVGVVWYSGYRLCDDGLYEAEDTLQADMTRLGALLHKSAVASFPCAVAVDDHTQRVFVLSSGTLNSGAAQPAAGEVTVLDAATGAILRAVSLGVDLQALLVDEAHSRVFVADCGPSAHDESGSATAPGKIYVLDSATGSMLQTVEVGYDPQVLALHPVTHRLFVANAQDDTVTVLEAASGQVERTVQAGFDAQAFGVVPEPPCMFLVNYSSTGSVTILDALTGEILREVPVGQTPCAAVVDTTANQVLVAKNFAKRITVLDARTGDTLYTIPLAHAPQEIVLFARGRRAFVLQPGPSATPVPGVVTILHKNALDRYEVTDAATTVGIWPRAMLFDERTRCLYVANAYEGTLSILDGEAEQGTLPLVKTVIVDRAAPLIRAMCLSQETGQIFVVHEHWERGHLQRDIITSRGYMSVLDAAHQIT